MKPGGFFLIEAERLLGSGNELFSIETSSDETRRNVAVEKER